MICNFMIFSESVGSGACLSASSLENQELTRIANKFTNNSKFVRIVLY